MQKIHSLVKNRKYTVHEQLSSLQACFKGGRYERRYNGFTWWFEVTPTPLSDTYLLKIVYNQHAVPLVYVEEPKPLLLAKGAKTLPHTYNSKKTTAMSIYAKEDGMDKFYAYLQNNRALGYRMAILL